MATLNEAFAAIPHIEFGYLRCRFPQSQGAGYCELNIKLQMVLFDALLGAYLKPIKLLTLATFDKCKIDDQEEARLL